MKERLTKFWRDPEHPPAEKMPRRREANKSALLGRALGGVAGVVLLVSSALGIWRSVVDTSSGGSPFRSLALLIPAVVLLRYAWTGRIALN